MKTIKTVITFLLLMLSMAVEAQTVVINIEKTDGTKDEYLLSEVDSVAYVPLQEVKDYYFYAGWTKPTSEAEIESLVASTAADGNGVSYKAALIGSWLSGFTYNFATDGNSISYTSRATFYLILPVGLSIYANGGANVVADQFDVETASWNNNYKVYTSKEGTRDLDYLNIK